MSKFSPRQRDLAFPKFTAKGSLETAGSRGQCTSETLLHKLGAHGRTGQVQTRHCNVQCLYWTTVKTRHCNAMYSSATVGCRQLSRQAGAVRELSSGAAFVQTSRWLAVMQKLAEAVIRQPENGKNRLRSWRETGLKAFKRNYDY